MQITAEYLNGLKKEAEAERTRLLTTLHQIGGAIGMIDIQLRRLAEPEPETPDETTRTPAS